MRRLAAPNWANRAAWPVAAFAALAAVFAESKLGSGPLLPGPGSPPLSLARMRVHNVCDRFRGSGIFKAKSPDS